MKFSRAFFSIASLIGTALAVPALATSLLIQEDDGTYRTEIVTSTEACKKLCAADSQKWRGSIILQMDVTKPEMICRLNDGKGSNAAFPSTPPEPLNINIAVSDLNSYRASHGLGPVRLNVKLNAASQVHAEDMARIGDATHYGSDGSSHSDRVQRQGYYFSLAGENVASGQKSWNAVFKAWQDSPGHNENLLQDEATEFGVALVYDPDSAYQTYWAMLVANPLPKDVQDVMRTTGLKRVETPLLEHAQPSKAVHVETDITE